MRLSWGQVVMVKSKQIPEKCRRCALLGAAEARSSHPQCWDDRLCHSRRSYARNRDKINQKRARVRIEQVHQVDVPQVNYGVLQVWRELREDSPIHAIGSLFDTTIVKILHEGLFIVGWVAMWRPIEIFLYDWVPIERDQPIFRKLSNVPIEIKPLDQPTTI